MQRAKTYELIVIYYIIHKGHGKPIFGTDGLYYPSFSCYFNFWWNRWRRILNGKVKKGDFVIVNIFLNDLN